MFLLFTMFSQLSSSLLQYSRRFGRFTFRLYAGEWNFVEHFISYTVVECSSSPDMSQYQVFPFNSTLQIFVQVLKLQLFGTSHWIMNTFIQWVTYP